MGPLEHLDILTERTLQLAVVAERLDEFGIHFIEGGWPGSNPKDAAFFEEAAKRMWRNAAIAAFGMTRRGGVRVEDTVVVTDDGCRRLTLAPKEPLVVA